MLCDYGCGNEGKYVTTTGRSCCSARYNSCPAVRARNSAGISKAHKDGRMCNPSDIIPWNKGLSFPELIKADFSLNGKGQHKKVLIHERGHKCEKCKNTHWLNTSITLELEHVDGNNKNNVKTNLMLLCPNCHSQTPTWRRAKDSGRNSQKYSDAEIINAITSSSNINQVLTKLDLRYGSVSTIMSVMIRHKINFTGC